MSEQRRSKVGWENVGNVGAMAEQDGMGKCQKCRSNGGARWGWENVGNVGAKSEQVDWENVGAELEQGGKENGI